MIQHELRSCFRPSGELPIMDHHIERLLWISVVLGRSRVKSGQTRTCSMIDGDQKQGDR